VPALPLDLLRSQVISAVLPLFCERLVKLSEAEEDAARRARVRVNGALVGSQPCQLCVGLLLVGV
jgi:hypothetical protein